MVHLKDSVAFELKAFVVGVHCTGRPVAEAVGHVNMQLLASKLVRKSHVWVHLQWQFLILKGFCRAQESQPEKGKRSTHDEEWFVMNGNRCYAGLKTC